MTPESINRQQTANCLRRARLDARLTLRELARRAGTSHPTLVAYESAAKVPSVVTFMRILEACGLAVEFQTTRRVRVKDGLARGEELATVLRLAEQFPARVSPQLELPVFPHA